MARDNINKSGKDSVNQAGEDILNEKEKKLFYINRAYENNNKKYIEGYFHKFVTDLDETRDYVRTRIYYKKRIIKNVF